MEHGVHAKLTGAGGEGGCVIGIMMPSKDNQNTLKILQEKFNSIGYTIYTDLKIDQQGLFIDN